LTTGDEAIRQLREAVQGLDDVGVLVNNAGVAEPGCVYLHKVDVESLVRMIRVNLSALTQVTAAVLPVMLEKGEGHHLQYR
jgi:17beta-estradiol 17-dehydrogenase / very-long-chain 3-oxoacyl-CoA reductase